MNYRHNLHLVRMFIPDQTWHCSVHGRLLPEEAEEVIGRMRMSMADIYATDRLMRRNPLIRAWAALHHFWAMLGRPKCEPVS